MKAPNPDSQIEQHYIMKESVLRMRKWAGMAVALVCIISGLALLGYCWRQQLFDQATTPPVANSRWTVTGSLNVSRYGHTSTLLVSSKVLVVGGGGALCYETSPTSRYRFSTVNSSAEVYTPIAIPKITGASVSGKKLIVRGEYFEPGAVILLNDEVQRTRNDGQSPKTIR
jgi:hypothetical protein